MSAGPIRRPTIVAGCQHRSREREAPPPPARLPALLRGGHGRALDTEPHKRDRSLLGIAADGLRLLARAPVLRAITASAGLYMAATGLLTVAFPFFAAEDLGAGKSAAGVLWAAFAVGSAVGALLGPRLLRRARPERVVAASFAGFGLVALLWPLASSLPAALLLVALAGVADGPGLTATF
ncbi:MAG: MFS transporter [Thermoleophilaceae bacterium]